MARKAKSIAKAKSFFATVKAAAKKFWKQVKKLFS